MARNRNKVNETPSTLEEIEETVAEEAVVEEAPVEETPKPKRAKKIKVVGCDRLNLREETNTDCEIIEVLEAGASLTVIESLDGWTKVKTASENEGYVMTEFTK